MRVLHLISSGGMYGAEAVILNLSHALRREGDESVIGSFGNAGLQLHERALAEGLPSMEIRCGGQFSPQTMRAIHEAVATHRVELVHSHGYKADVYAWAALRGSGMALVSTCHTWYDNDVAVRVYGALDRWVLRRFSRVVAVSAEVEERLRRSGISAQRVRRIRNGIDLQPFAGVAGSRGTEPAVAGRTAGLVGRLAPEKGVDVFLEAAAIVSRALPEVRFVVAGDGPERSRLEAQRRDLGLVDRLQLPGHADSMVAVYAAMDLLVSASRQEGLPIALLEGMASGLPVVGTAVGDVSALVAAGETGLLVAADDASALAEAMLRVLRDDGLRTAMGRNARALVARDFSVDRMTSEYREVYREAIAASKGRA